MISAGGAAAMVPMIEAMNPGWAFTFIGLVYAVWTSMLFLIMKKGQQWRDEKAAKQEEKRAAKEANETVEHERRDTNTDEDNEEKETKD